MSIVTYPQDCLRAPTPLGFCCSPTIRKINRTKVIMWKDKVSERLKQKQWKRSLGSHETNKGIACSVKHTLDPHVRYKAYIWPQCPVSSQPGNIWPLLPLNENRCLPSFDKQALTREIRSCFVLVFFSSGPRLWQRLLRARSGLGRSRGRSDFWDWVAS